MTYVFGWILSLTQPNMQYQDYSHWYGSDNDCIAYHCGITR